MVKLLNYVLENTIEYIVIQIVALIGTSGGVERGRGCEAAGRVGARLARELYRDFPYYSSIIMCSLIRFIFLNFRSRLELSFTWVECIYLQRLLFPSVYE